MLPAFVRGWLRSIIPAEADRFSQPFPPAADLRAPAVVATPPPATAPLAESPLAERPAIDLESFLRFSVDDLWYAETDLDRAMDLLAICRLDPNPPLD